ncbi:AraC family transcriptional regulator [Chitinophaga pinensis]|uniref:Helix-turn-helix domain-containing protein n=1 Tax=Chitinophaga pinensis TaxID=79329 RepID=A0A5C6LTB3_9BACT|nr:helix-turn-helix transcriptional regulator [Chitinophaga pinensis]TWW00423.1 helix-turn-helix domain-containing protein [Chitinophaga pinensis]
MKGQKKRQTINNTFLQEDSIGLEIFTMEELHEQHYALLSQPLRTNTYQVLIFFTAIPHHAIDFSPVIIRPYSTFFVRKGRVHTFDPHARYEGIVINFTEDFACRDEHDLILLHQHPLFNGGGQIDLQDIDTYREMIETMMAESRKPKDEFSRMFLRNLLQNFLILSGREYTATHPFNHMKGPDMQYVQRYNVLIEKHYKTVRTVAGYAAILRITEKRLNQATTNVSGRSPKQLIDDYIMIAAKRLLSFTIMTVKEIGFELGFSQTTHFIKYFTKHTGLSPASFRQQQYI